MLFFFSELFHECFIVTVSGKQGEKQHWLSVILAVVCVEFQNV